MTSVAIAVLTYRRPAGLGQLLEGLAALDVPADVALRVVVVDNDPDGSGRAVAEGWAAPAGVDLTYAVEARRGIATARNTSMALAVPGSDAVVLIDDDEVPEPGWLAALVGTWRATGADVVQGPVLPRFEQPPPAWAVQGGYFDRPRFPDRAPMRWATSNNTLVRAALLGGAPFDERYNLTGGSDTQLFERLQRDGARIHFAAEAVVHETVPASRVEVGWVLRREYRRGLTLSRVLIDTDRSPARLAKRVAAGLQALAQGGLGVARGVVGRDPAVRLRGRHRISYGAGLLAGLVGVRYHEYRRTHGT